MASAFATPGLIDSTILIDASRLVPNATQFLAAQQASAPTPPISIITAMELVVGCRDKQELNTTLAFLAQFTLIPISSAASQQAYHLLQSFFLSHSLGMADSLIAAAALEHGLTLYTLNVKHFQMIPGLHVIRPY